MIVIDRRTLLRGPRRSALRRRPCLRPDPRPPARAPRLRTARIPGANVNGAGHRHRHRAALRRSDTARSSWRRCAQTIARFVALGGTVIDTAPSYGRAEEVVGQLVAELGLRDRLFLATKVGVDSREEGAAQIEAIVPQAAHRPAST